MVHREMAMRLLTALIQAGLVGSVVWLGWRVVRDELKPDWMRLRQWRQARDRYLTLSGNKTH